MSAVQKENRQRYQSSLLYRYCSQFCFLQSFLQSFLEDRKACFKLFVRRYQRAKDTDDVVVRSCRLQHP